MVERSSKEEVQTGKTG